MEDRNVTDRTYHLFEVFGIEVEYMIVDSRTLDVRPVADQVLSNDSEEVCSDVEVGPLTWSNELALHLIELKNTRPSRRLAELPAAFRTSLWEVERRLAPLNCRLLPGAMHPWMRPEQDTKLWSYDNREIYEAYDRIFDCSGHGWLNLQSIHMNLPFGNADEFGRLHAAVRLVLPLLPALAASSPIYEGRLTGWMDSRLEVYRKNQARIPSITGSIIPEPIFDPDEYMACILEPMYRDIQPLDLDGILQEEWLNSRGSIARFDRNTFEIRLIDTQECVTADFAVYDLVRAVLRGMVEERWSSYTRQKEWSVERLRSILDETILSGGFSRIFDTEYLAMFGLKGADMNMSGRDAWRALAQRAAEEARLEFPDAVLNLVALPTLAERITCALGSNPSHSLLFYIWTQLADCLRQDCFFIPKLPA